MRLHDKLHADKSFVSRQRSIIETINDQLKNISREVSILVIDRRLISALMFYVNWLLTGLNQRGLIFALTGFCLNLLNPNSGYIIQNL